MIILYSSASEAVVQATLDVITSDKNRTVIQIAHRLSHSDRRAGFLHSRISQNSPINPPEISFSTQITQ